jgi:hypothetical protein
MPGAGDVYTFAHRASPTRLPSPQPSAAPDAGDSAGTVVPITPDRSAPERREEPHGSSFALSSGGAVVQQSGGSAGAAALPRPRGGGGGGGAGVAPGSPRRTQVAPHAPGPRPLHPLQERPRGAGGSAGNSAANQSQPEVVSSSTCRSATPPLSGTDDAAIVSSGANTGPAGTAAVAAALGTRGASDRGARASSPGARWGPDPGARSASERGGGTGGGGGASSGARGAAARAGGGGGTSGSIRGEAQTWLVLEYADKGSLADAVEDGILHGGAHGPGWARAARGSGGRANPDAGLGTDQGGGGGATGSSWATGSSRHAGGGGGGGAGAAALSVDLPRALVLLLDVARGMAYLHARCGRL